MSAPTTPSQSAEDYLERIHELLEAKGYARVVDIAAALKVRQTSVTSMVQKLGRAGRSSNRECAARKNEVALGDFCNAPIP